MFKEVDAPTLGWEVYARKDQFYQETGIALSAGASHSTKSKGETAPESPFLQSTLHYALQAFLHNSIVTGDGVNNFVSSYGADADGLGEYLATLSKGRLHAPDYKDGFEATVLAIKANEAVVKGEKVMLPKELFEI